MPKYAELGAFRELNLITDSDGGMLHREARLLALRRIEEGARTQADFENVLHWWDRLDANRERRERMHEVGRSTVPLEWDAVETLVSGSPSYDVVLRRLILSGDFIDCIYDSPETLHELVTDADLSRILVGLKPRQKNMLYYLLLHDYSTSEYAQCVGQSDRNIRGIRRTALDRIRRLYGNVLSYRKDAGIPMTADERYFIDNGVRGQESGNG